MFAPLKKLNTGGMSSNATESGLLSDSVQRIFPPRYRGRGAVGTRGNKWIFLRFVYYLRRCYNGVRVEVLVHYLPKLGKHNFSPNTLEMYNFPGPGGVVSDEKLSLSPKGFSESCVPSATPRLSH